MQTDKIDKQLLEQLLFFQKNEITEHHIYLRLSKSIKNRENSKILQKIAHDELKHYEFWMK